MEILEDSPAAVAELASDFPAGYRQAVDMLLTAARETAARVHRQEDLQGDGSAACPGTENRN